MKNKPEPKSAMLDVMKATQARKNEQAKYQKLLGSIEEAKKEAKILNKDLRIKEENHNFKTINIQLKKLPGTNARSLSKSTSSC